MCARYFFFRLQVHRLSRSKKKKTEIRFSKPYSRYSLFFKRITTLYVFFIKR